MKVTVYSTTTCPWCVKAKEYLKENGVPFEEKNVSKDREAAMYMIDKTGQRGVPVIDINDNFIVGFDKEQIDKLLNL
jgi:glutaredoxin-like YruB-family protein